MTRNINYYERRMDFIVSSLVDGTISKGDLIRNRDKIRIVMKSYANEHGTNNSPLSFTVLQDILGAN